MLDVHAHILPGLDDGSGSEEESIKMLAYARQQGIRGVIATPHCSELYPNLDPDRILERCKVLQEHTERLKMAVSIYPGQELFYSEQMMEHLAEGRALTLAGSNYILVEFHPVTPYSLICSAVREIRLVGYLPVLAHIERYQALRESDKTEELVALGAYTQMNYSSVSGGWTDARARWCRKMLKKGTVHLLGTDMHDLQSRRPETGPAVKWMKSHLDEEYYFDITQGNAERILKNELLREREEW